MIKFMKLEGYVNIGEIQLFSHVYQLYEENKNEPILILINAYNTEKNENKVFKGFVYEKSKQYKCVKLSDNEIDEIKKYIGGFREVDLEIFVKDTVLCNSINNFQKIN